MVTGLAAAIGALLYALLLRLLPANALLSQAGFSSAAIFLCAFILGISSIWLHSTLSSKNPLRNTWLQHVPFAVNTYHLDKAIIDSLTAHIAVLDSSGTIVVVNESWKRFGRENGAPAEVCAGVGLNYLDICRAAAEANAHGADAALKGISGILDGSNKSFTLEYPCHSQNEKRWFLMIAQPHTNIGGGVILLHINVTERKQLRDALQERELRLQLILDQIPAVLWSTDRELKYTSVRQNAAKASNRETPLNVDLAMKQLNCGEEESNLIINNHKLALEGQDISYEVAVDGHDYQAFVQPFLDVQGKIQGVLGIALDISERKRAERELQQQSARLQVLSEASKAFSEASLEAEAVLATMNTIARRTAELVGDTCVITLLSEDGRWLTPIAFFDPDPQVYTFLQTIMTTTPYPVELGIAGSVVRSKKAILIENCDQEQIRGEVQSLYRPFVERFGIYSLVIVPLFIQGILIGTIGIMRGKPGRPYTFQDQVFLQDLADRAALAIQNARLFEETQKRKDDLAALHTDLKRSHNLISALSLVASQIQNSLDPADVITRLGSELKKLEVVYFIGLLDPSGQAVVWQYHSIEPAVFSEAEQLALLTYQDLTMPLDHWPNIQALFAERKGAYINDALNVSQFLLPTIPEARLQQSLQKLGFTQNTHMIILPLIVEQRAVGVMSVWGDRLSEVDVPAFSIFAGQVAAALENARLFGITKSHADELSALTARLSEVEEMERRRLAQELHDQVGQMLTALGINLNVIRNTLPGNGSMQQPVNLIDDSLGLIEATIERTRDIMADLRPPVLDDYGLLAALHWYAEQFARRTGLKIDVRGDDLPALPAMVETALFRISQEAFLNVAKHANAEQILVDLNPENDRLRLSIEDNGCGFDPEILNRPERKPSWGVRSMRERVEEIGGQISIVSEESRGTKIIIEVFL